MEESSAAATALVNMCQDAAAAAVALDKGGIERVMERVREGEGLPHRGVLARSRRRPPLRLRVAADAAAATPCR